MAKHEHPTALKGSSLIWSMHLSASNRCLDRVNMTDFKGTLPHRLDWLYSLLVGGL